MGEVMEEYSYCNELKNGFDIKELDSMTLSSRIDGFVSACNLDLSNSLCEKLISVTRVSYVNKKLNEDKLKYNINFARGYDDKLGRYFIIIGKYNDLDLLFTNYYGKDRNLNKINSLPYQITLMKMFDNYNYSINIESNGLKTKFELVKRKDDNELNNTLAFYANVRDFNKTLMIVKSFVNNPKVVFDTYNEVMNSKKVSFSTNDLDQINTDQNDKVKRKHVKR